MRRHRVAAVVMDQVAAFEMALVSEVFGVDRRGLTPRWYEFRLCAVGPRPVHTTTGFTIDTPHGPEALRWADTIVVIPTGREDYPAELVNGLRAAHARGARIVSICTGAFVVAAAGLLDGRRATTHWMEASELARRYPAVEVDPNVLYIDHGDIATSAGAASGLDLCLHLVRRDLGADIANDIARRLVILPHREGGQAQYIERPMASPEGDTLFDDVLEWAQQHLGESLTVETLAGRAAMSERTFARRFRDATGTTPHQWLTVERVKLAQRLLEATDRSIDWIAIDAGFGTATNMRQHFQRLLRVSPGRYREAFRARQSA